MTTIGVVEIGGTKTLVAVTDSLDGLANYHRVPTTTPDETLEGVLDYLESSGVSRVGIASFGPVELRPDHDAYGSVTGTPKPKWSNTRVVSRFADRLGVPVAFETDVNAAALGEGKWGAAAGLSDFAYVTVGTGIGGGVVANGSPLHGAPHPELGHVVVRRHPDDDHPGSCPFHADCLEGMASGPAVESRFGRPGDQLAGSDLAEASDVVAFYVAQGLRNLVYVAAPERIVVGGGVSKLPDLHAKVRANLVEELAGYPAEAGHLSSRFVVEPDLGDLSALAGALILATGPSG